MVTAPSVIVPTGLFSVVSVPSWPALQLIGAVLAEDAELMQAAGDGANAGLEGYCVHLPPTRRRARFWAESRVPWLEPE